MAEGGGGESSGGAPCTVFISYASQDAAVANSLLAALEENGVRCWIAPRDVVPGSLYADGIVRAISEAKVVVLVLSERSVASPHVGKEIERASSKRRPIIAFRIDSAPLTPAFEYFLSESQWIDLGSGDPQAAAAKLVDAARRHCDASAPGEPRPIPHSPASNQRTAQYGQNRAVIIAIALVGLAVAGLLVDRFPPFERFADSKRAMTVTPVAAVAVASKPAIAEKSVAVLPFVDMSQKKDQEYFSDGLSEELIDRLTKIPDLRVPARTSSFYFKGKQAPISEIARVLGVSHVLEGSIRKSGNTLRVTAQLIRADTGFHVWSETYDRKLDDIFKVQDEIAAAVVDVLKSSLIDRGTKTYASTRNVEAYTLYLQGRSIAQRAFTREDIGRAIDYVQRALAADPEFALAWAQLSRLYSANWGYGDRGGMLQWRGAALQAARKSLELDPRLAEGRVAMAKISFSIDWDWTSAEADVRAAYQSEPTSPDVLAWVEHIAELRGHWDEAARLEQRLIAQDPLNSGNYWSLGDVYLRLGRLADAEIAFRKFLELDPRNLVAHWKIAESLFLRGDFQAARAELAQEQPDGRDLGYVFLDYAVGQRAESDVGMLAAEMKYRRTPGWDAAYYLACARAFRGERDQAFGWLDQAFERHEGALATMTSEPLLKNIESDPRYVTLRRRMKLSE